MKTVKILDAQFDVSEEVKDECALIWRWQEYGNDYYYYATTLADLRDVEGYGEKVSMYDSKLGRRLDKPVVCPNLIKYLEEQGVTENENILIHYWW